MKVYMATIWSPFRLSMSTKLQQQVGESDYDYLKRVEETENFGVSSDIPVLSQSHLDDIIQAIYCETDHELSSHMSPDRMKFDRKHNHVIDNE
ncbi:MAG: hypothetical protein AXW14_08545 [Alteromonas sp. Nap_26]|nr:MAG: hypothetical protein AXW14_08545 [Alteromonas sp. Nap_26]